MVNKGFNQSYVRVPLFWNCRVRYRWIIFIFGQKNWHRCWCCIRTLFRRSTGKDLSGPLISTIFPPLNFFILYFFCFFKSLSKKIFDPSPEILVKFGRDLPPAWSKATFSTLRNLKQLESSL